MHRTVYFPLCPSQTAEVYKQNFWLGLYDGAVSPKPLVTLSNSTIVTGFYLGKLTAKKRKECTKVKTTRFSADRFGQILGARCLRNVWGNN